MPRRRARREIARVGLRAKDWLQQSTQTRPRSASGRQLVVRSWASDRLAGDKRQHRDQQDLSEPRHAISEPETFSVARLFNSQPSAIVTRLFLR